MTARHVLKSRRGKRQRGFVPTTRWEGAMAKYLLVSFKSLSLGAARRNRAAREEDRLRVPAHRARQPARLVPSLYRRTTRCRCCASMTGFRCSNSSAICEYLDETHSPRLHPEDPIERAINRAWIEYMPSFRRSGLGPCLCRQRGRLRQGGGKDPGCVRKARGGAGAPGWRSILQRRPLLLWWMRPMRPSCSAISSWSGSGSSATSRNFRASRRGRRRSVDRPSTHSFPTGRIRGDVSATW